jgi:serine/threonine-protein kinase
VKLLSEEVSEHPDLVARQRDEARLLAQLNHDHIVKVMDLTEIGGRPAILMEYVDGIDANHLYKRVPFPLRAALEAIAAAASALAAAYGTVSPRTGSPLHAIHRDIKPSNLLVSAHGGLKVLDFGVARANFDREGATESVQFGTPRFMAPEQWLRGDVGPEVDVYALALTFLSLATGREHERLPLDPLRYQEAKSHLLAELPAQPPLVDVVDRMLAYEPRRRPSAAQVHDIFSALAEQTQGESLAKFARRVVPSLVAERRERWASDSLRISARTRRTSLRSTAILLPSPRRVLVRASRFASAMLALFLVGAMALATGLALRESHPPTDPPTATVARPEARGDLGAGRRGPPPRHPRSNASQRLRRRIPKASAGEAAAAAVPAPVDPPPAQASPTYDITVSSLAARRFRVHVDDVDRGLTPAMKLVLPEGRHTLVLVADDGTRTPAKTITVAKFAPKHWTWNTETGRWDY